MHTAMEQEAVLNVVESFFAGISSRRPPFVAARELISPDAFCVFSHLDELWVNRLDKTMDRIESKVHAAMGSIKEFREELTQPGPEIWVSGDLAAVWTGHQTLIDGNRVAQSIKLISLHKTATGWKICGVADSQQVWGCKVLKEAEPEMLERIYAMCKSVADYHWDSTMTFCLTGGGKTSSRRHGEGLVSSTWPEMMENAKEPPVGKTESTAMTDIEVRVCGGFAFAWTTFVIQHDGGTTERIVAAITLLKDAGKWLITGCQDTSLSLAKGSE